MRSEPEANRLSVDFHLHTTASDGRRTPEQMVEQAIAAGLRRMAITDHDTVAGVLPAARAAAGRIELVPGIEFTCREAVLAPGMPAVSLHLLGYGINPEHPALTAALAARTTAVRQAYQALLDALGARGCPLQYAQIPARCGPNHLELADIDRAVQAACPQSPDLAALRAMVADHAAVMDRQNLSIQKAVELIHQAGGVAVWAHPFHVYRQFRKRELNFSQAEAVLRTLLPWGADGLEACYRAFSEEQRAALALLARQQGLLCTAGSDCHGIPPRDQVGVDCPAQWLETALRHPAFGPFKSGQSCRKALPRAIPS